MSQAPTEGLVPEDIVRLGIAAIEAAPASHRPPSEVVHRSSPMSCWLF